MNLKQAKRLRRELKADGFDWRDTDYILASGISRRRGGTVVLDIQCGKHVYRMFKQMEPRR